MNRIEDYGLIGDCFGSALIALDGSVDWLALRRFDSNPVCWSLLDDEKGACLKVIPSGNYEWRHGYLEDTNILITEAISDESRIIFYDFMPVARKNSSSTHDYTSLESLHSLVRFIRVTGKPIEAQIIHRSSSFEISAKSTETYLYFGDENLNLRKDSEFKLSLEEDSLCCLVLTDSQRENLHIDQMKNLFSVTRSFWKEWINYSQYKGPHEALIRRSALTLKLLIHAETGAIMAAPTTSLPEEIGGERNWDYRYCWIRDATFTLYAFGYLGFSGEADKFSGYMEAIARKAEGPLKVLYNLDGDSFVPEREVRGIKGYQGSSPVRIGNDAYKQCQLDTNGEFMDWAYLHRRLGGELSQELFKQVKETAEWVSANWRQKDRGLWEIRGEKEDYTYSKVMCWVTLDRAGSLLGDLDLYKNEKKEIETYIREHCIRDARLMRSRQNPGLDASLLLVKAVGFPIEEEIYEKTVDEILRTLGNGPFIKRYSGNDGLSGSEGDFLICSFWAVNACLFLGRKKQAEDLFEELLKFVSGLGLMSEEYDSEKKRFLGNFPQALSHLALIETASYFELFEKGGKEALIGCHGDRAGRMHTTLHGPRAVWNFLLKTKKVRKLFPSNASKMKSTSLPY